ncbi:MAG: penicillin-binding protein 2 [Coriobacteriia bacterium]|nr:penicillin-binding protein 2 [Coriobacteriia bacterium]
MSARTAQRGTAGNLRPLIIFAVLCILALMVFVRLYYIQITSHEVLAQAATEQRSSGETTVQARRGTIYDRNGVILATSVQKVSIYIWTPEVSNPQMTAAVLADLLGGSISDWEPKVQPPPAGNSWVELEHQMEVADYQKYVDAQTALYSTGSKDFIAQLQQQYGSNFSSDFSSDFSSALTGIRIEKTYVREYPCGNTGAQIIGSLNSDGQAISGLELEYDSILKGTDGLVVDETSQGSLPLPNATSDVIQEKQDGEDIVVSIDIDVQAQVESELVKYAAAGNVDNGNIILINAENGEILAGASLPLLNRDYLSQEDLDKGALNLQAITLNYEPGSVLKAVTASAALDQGLITPDEQINVPAYRVINGATVHDWDGRSVAKTADLRWILSNSSNVGMTLVGERMSHQALYNALYNDGFCQSSNVDYPGEYDFSQQTTDFPVSSWRDIDAANRTFGQGVFVSTLQVASFYGAIANNGLRVQPHFLVSESSDPTPVSYPSYQVMKPDTAATMTDLLESVMTEGTGTPADLPGYQMAGKTGTAQVFENGSYDNDDTIGSMVGFFVGSDCKIVCMTSMKDPGKVGEGVAPKPLFASVMLYLAQRYQVQPSDVNAANSIALPLGE